MSQPTPYDRQFNFQNQAILTPSDPPPADEMDSEFNALKVTLDETLANLAKIQRDDGALANASVARETLHSSVDLGFGAPSVWTHNTNYTADFDTIFHESKFYKCAITHLSDPSPLGFANDIAKWTLIADFSAAAIQGLGTMSTQNANLVIITGGTITGTTISVALPTIAAHAASKLYVDLEMGTMGVYINAQDAALTANINAQVATLNGKLSAASGTRMLFQQTSAPVGWTKITTYTDHALRLVGGSISAGGGAAGFSTVFGRTATDSIALTQANIPSYYFNPATLTVGVATIAAQNLYTRELGVVGGGTTIRFATPAATNNGSDGSILQTVSLTGSLGGNLHSGGSGSAHSHPIEMRVAYIDVILASKD